ncbi:MAG: thiamine phosphate synthase [Chromatiales bacterium]|jgi:thiamine-phosphate pyrophosphorylase|nr:thiamine phosphate synthase [Chromatiales bacterium]
MKLDPFYPIFDSCEWLARLLPLGIRMVQLRIKDTPEPALREAIRQAKELCDAHQCQLIVNDYWRIAIEEGCDFVHLGQEDLDDADVAAIRDAGLALGLSTHDDEELDRALALSPEYIALGPVYPTKLKKMRWEQQGLGRVGDWKRRVGDVPLVAIGGMTVERAKGAFEAGADIVSAVTDITWNDDPETRIKHWVAATRAYGNE